MTTKKNKKYFRPLLVLLAVFVMGTGIMSFLSLYKLYSPNPFLAAYGAAQILWGDTDYVEIRKNPRVVISKPDDPLRRLIGYMEAEGYTYYPEGRLGAALEFQKGEEKQIVSLAGNGYYSLWTFETFE